METIARSRSWVFTPKHFVETGRLPAAHTITFLKQCAAGMAGTLLITLVGLALHLNLATAGLLYLLLTVFFSVHCGFWQASIISVAAIVCEGYCFAPPRYSFYIADPQNGISIVIFEVTALLVSRLAWREKAYSRETGLQRQRLDQLYAVSRGALRLDLHSSAESQLAELIRKECGLEAVALTIAGVETLATAGYWPCPAAAGEDQRSRNSTERRPGLSTRDLLLAEGRTGVLMVLGHLSPLSMDALSSLVSLTLDRHRAFTRESAAEAARQAEQLRTAVLDGLAHAFKTPLTVIRAASSGLLATGPLDEFQHELAALIDEHSIRLDQMASQLLKTARLAGENICLQTEQVWVRLLIEEVVGSVVRQWDHRENGASAPLIDVTPCSQDLCIVADYDLVACTLKELLENAAKYCDVGSKIRVSAAQGAQGLIISVRNRGPVILLEDRERIFERFYRCAAHRHAAPGTGMGLSVARRVMEAHGGDIWVVSNEIEGTTFYFSLPMPMHGHQKVKHEERTQACH